MVCHLGLRILGRLVIAAFLVVFAQAPALPYVRLAGLPVMATRLRAGVPLCYRLGQAFSFRLYSIVKVLSFSSFIIEQKGLLLYQRKQLHPLP